MVMIPGLFNLGIFGLIPSGDQYIVYIYMSLEDLVLFNIMLRLAP